MSNNEYEFDYSKLRGRIVEKFGKQEHLAKAIGIGYVSLSKRLNNHLDFSVKEILKMCTFLEITLDDIPKYFFTTKVQKHEQWEALK